MGEKRMDPKQQFSKRLARWTAFFWFLYMTWLSVLMLLAPDSALYAVYMAVISTVVMLINVASYNHNSITEKVLLTALDKAKLEFSLKNTASKQNTDEAEQQEGDDG